MFLNFISHRQNLLKHFLFIDYHDAVFVVGALDETLILRGMRYHPIDIENSVMRAHKKIAEWLVMFHTFIHYI